MKAIKKNSNTLCLFMYVRYLKDAYSSLFGILDKYCLQESNRILK